MGGLNNSTYMHVKSQSNNIIRRRLKQASVSEKHGAIVVVKYAAISAPKTLKWQ